MVRVCSICLVLLASASCSTTPKSAENQGASAQRPQGLAERVASAQYPQGMEASLSSARRTQIALLKKLSEQSLPPNEAPLVLFRLGDLCWEEARFLDAEARRKDDEIIAVRHLGEVGIQGLESTRRKMDTERRREKHRYVRRSSSAHAAEHLRADLLPLNDARPNLDIRMSLFEGIQHMLQGLRSDVVLGGVDEAPQLDGRLSLGARACERGA